MTVKESMHALLLSATAVGGMVLTVTGCIAPVAALLGLVTGTPIETVSRVLLTGGAMFVIGLFLLVISVWLDEASGRWPW